MELDNKITPLNMLDTTKQQVLAIQSNEIIKYLLNKAMMRMYDDSDVVKIQQMFNIINGNDINYGIKETNCDR